MRSKIKVLVNYQGKRGSGPSYSLEWVKGLQSCGCEVYAVISNEVFNLSEWKNVLDDEHLFFVDTHKDYSKVDLLIKTFLLVTQGKKELQSKFGQLEFDFSFHTFYCHWANLIDSFLNVKKVVAVCHDPIAHSGSRFYIQYLFKRHYIKADEIFTLTKSFKQIVHEQFGTPNEHVHYIPHGRMQMYNNYSRKMYDSLCVKKNKYNFLFFGFIEHYKGLNILSEAYKKIRGKRDDVRLIVAGNGNFKPYQKGFYGVPDVTIVNRYIRDEEVGALFAGPNTICILPYLNATQSGVIPVAYEFLTPIIASDTGGLKEQLDDGRIGLLFECNNANSLAERMFEIIDNSDEYNMQQRLMRAYRETLNWDNLSKELLKKIGYM